MKQEVHVTNKHPRVLQTAFEGVTYVFEPGQKIAIPAAAAVNIFGFNQVNKFDAMRRGGFTSAQDFEKWLGNFDFEHVEYVRKEEVDEIALLKIDLEKATERIRELENELAKVDLAKADPAKTPATEKNKKSAR